MEVRTNGHEQPIHEHTFSRETFTKESGVLTLLDLDPNSSVTIDKPVIKQSITYYFQP